ncbi:MAG: adenylate/guanylate cyclase domain-containing protein [Burkholderiaceae bacterium]|nr:MAG: adenylate/guanylate cyclase domain-containing protein [Burkholderiaceae bacterium]
MAVLKKSAMLQWLSVRSVALAMALACVLWALAATRTWQDIELKGFDRLSIASAPGRSELPIVLVGIDDASLAELQQRWPWPRGFHARLIDALSTAGAAVIAFDVLFEFPTDPSEDVALAQALQRAGSVVLAAGLVQQETQHGTAWMRKDPLPLLRDAAAGVGLVNLLYDRDQALRRIPDNDDAFWRRIAARLRQQMPDMTFPSLPLEGSLIRYAGPPGTYPRISFYQALDPARYLPEGELEGALVIVGRDTRSAADIGAAQVDTFATPFTQSGHPHMVGMEIHANVFENVLKGNAIRPLSAGVGAAVAGLCVLLAALAMQRFRPLRAAAVALVLMLAVLLLAWLLFTRGHWWLPVGTSLLGIAVMYLLQAGAAYLAERQQRLLIKHMFSRYVPEAVVEQLAAHPERLTLGGEHRELTLLFTDLAGFTSQSENLTPQQTAELINRYLTTMNQVVFDQGGSIDKFIGDAVMAFWNAPLADPDHALHAVRAACAMQQAMPGLNSSLAADGLPALSMRIGVHTGQVLVGNMGSRIGRLSYTAIGDAVNLASRLEGANKAYGTGILISGATVQLLTTSIPLRVVDLVRVKGKQQAIEVFTPCDDTALAQRSEQAVHAFRRADWDAAQQQWQDILHSHPQDPLAPVYLERIAALRREPPAQDWDGSMALDTK